jgi:hypothetical protein
LNIILQVLLGLTDVSSLVGFWRVKCLKKGILIVLGSYIIGFTPVMAPMLIGVDTMTALYDPAIITLALYGMVGMIGFRMFFLYRWTKMHNEKVQSLSNNNSENQ